MSQTDLHPTRAEIQAIFDQADCLFSNELVEHSINELATKISAELAQQNPLVLSVMTGGMVLTGQLLTRLHFPLQLDYLHATRYRDKTRGGQLDWVVKPSVELKDRTLLIVDDILDEGHTLQAIIEFCQTQGAAKVYTAVLVDKRHERKAKPGMRADFAALSVVDRFIFGFGMDYQGYWRNAPGIYAVKGL